MTTIIYTKPEIWRVQSLWRSPDHLGVPLDVGPGLMELLVLVAWLATRNDVLRQTIFLDVNMSTEDGLIPALMHSAGRWKGFSSLSLPEASPSLPPPELRGSSDVFDPVCREERHTLI